MTIIYTKYIFLINFQDLNFIKNYQSLFVVFVLNGQFCDPIQTTWYKLFWVTFFTLANGISSSGSKGRLFIIFVILLLVNLRICQVKMILKIFIVNSCGRWLIVLFLMNRIREFYLEGGWLWRISGSYSKQAIPYANQSMKKKSLSQLFFPILSDQ